MASANATKNDISLDEIFNAIDLPTTNVTSKNDTYEGHTHTFYAESNVGNVTKNIGYQASEFVISNVGNTEKFQNDYEDTRSEISRISKATSVSVHSSVSQKSANHYDLPPIPQYDVPPVVKDNSDESSHHSEASSKNSSKHSVHTHDSESTITNGTLVNEPIVVGEVASTLSTPVVVGKSTEHDAVIEQFKKLHEKEPSLVPESHHELESESEDSIAPNTLTKHQIPTLVKAQDLETIDFKTSNYSIPPSNKGHLDNESENSFGFEHVEYKELNGSGSRTGSVAHFTQVESLTEQTYHSVYKNHDVPTAVFDEDINHHSQHQNNDYYHHDVDQINVKTSRSNTASTQHTHQSSTLLANSPGPKITEELRPATVVKETETHIEPPILAYVAPVPTKPPRHQSEKKTVDAYDAYGNEEYQVVQNVIKDSTVVHEDIRHGPGVHELRLKFDNGVQPPLAPVLLVKKMEEERNAHNHQHHHHHQHHQQEGRHQTEADQIQVGEHLTPSSPKIFVDDNRLYDIPFEPDESQKNHSFTTIENISNVSQQLEHFYETSTNEKKVLLTDARHHYVPQIKVITEYRHIEPRHHFFETPSPTKPSSATFVNSPVFNYSENHIENQHHFIPSTPLSPIRETKQIIHEHSYIPIDAKINVEGQHQTSTRAHNYLPSSAIKEEYKKAEIERHHYVPEIPKSFTKRVDQNLREHSYIPLDPRELINEKEETGKLNFNQHHYLPLTPAIKKNDKKEICHEHNYLPIIQKKEQIPRHENSAISHHFMPLSLKKTDSIVANFDKISNEHHFLPLASYVQQPVVAQKNEDFSHHHYYPKPNSINIKNSSVNQQKHHYISLTFEKVTNETMSRQHGYIPSYVAEEKQSKTDLSHHHYLPPKSIVDKKTVTDNNYHQYYPIAPKKQSVGKIDHKDHNYIPIVQNEKTRPSLPREHQYIPIVRTLNTSTVEDSKVNNDEHHYLPPLKLQTEKSQELNRNHGYIPVVEQKLESTQKGPKFDSHQFVPFAPRQNKGNEKVSEHVQLGGSRKSSVQSSISDYRHPQNHHHHHHHHHENKHEKRNDVPSRPSGFSNSVENKSHSRTSSVSTVKSSFPIQRVLPTVHNNYGDHLSVRVVKNVRQFVVEFDPKHPVPPPAPFAGTPKLSNSPRTPISPKTFEPLNTDHQQLTHRKSVSSIGGGVKPFNGSRKSSVASTCSSRSTIVGGNIVSRSRQSTITKENVDSRHQKHDANDDEIEIIRVNEVRKLFEKFGPTSLPEYASLPSAYLH